MLAEGLALCFRDSVRRLLLGSILTRFHSADLLELEQDATEDEATGHKFSPQCTDFCLFLVAWGIKSSKSSEQSNWWYWTQDVKTIFASVHRFSLSLSNRIDDTELKTSRLFAPQCLSLQKENLETIAPWRKMWSSCGIAMKKTSPSWRLWCRRQRFDKGVSTRNICAADPHIWLYAFDHLGESELNPIYRIQFGWLSGPDVCVRPFGRIRIESDL